MLTQNLQNLGATIGGTMVNAFKPLITALNQAIKKFNDFAVAISNSIGTILGWTYDSGSTGATEEVADDTEETADNLGTAASNAKKLKQNLMGIDELNINSGDSDSSSGTGSSTGTSGTDTSGKWTKGEGLLDNYTSDIDTWFKLGLHIQESITDGLEGIDWDKIFEKFNNFGKDLANFLNGLISPLLFSDLGTNIANCINSALQLLNGFGTTFDWTNFGDSLGSGLNAFMLKFDWDTALSNAVIFGTGIADTINAAFEKVDFSLVGQTVANAINTKIEFWLSMGKELNFTMFGEKLSQALTSFFNTLALNDLGEAIKVWICGALDMAATMLKKTDFDKIGQKIGDFLVSLDFKKILSKLAKTIWEAIKAAFSLVTGMMKEAPLETALIAGFALLKFTKVGTVVSKAISTSISTKLATLLGTTIGANSSIGTSLSNGLLTHLGVVKTALVDSFGLAASTISSTLVPLTNVGSLLTNIGTIGSSIGTSIVAGLEQIHANMTPLMSGLTGILAIWGEFSSISGTITNLVSGAQGLVSGIAQIGVEAGVASAALYAAFGPAGLVLSALTAVAAAIKGVNEAWDEETAKSAGNAIHDAMTNPGGTPIETLSSNVVTQIDSIRTEFDAINTKSGELTTAQNNVKETAASIDEIKNSVLDGAYTAAEKIPEINAAFETLKTESQTLFEEEYNIVYTGIAGSLRDVLEDMGYTVPQIMAIMSSFKSDYNTQVEEIETNQYNLDQAYQHGLISEEEYFNSSAENAEKLAGLQSQLSTTEAAVDSFSDSIDDIDFSSITNEDGSLNTAALTQQIDAIKTSADQTRDSVSGANETLTTAIQDLMNKAEEAGNTEALNALGDTLKANATTVDEANTSIDNSLQQYADTIQTQLINNIPAIADQAMKDYQNKSWAYKWFHSEEDYVEQYISDYKTNTIDPAVEGLKGLYEDMGTEGTTWASEASQAIIQSVFDGEYVRQQDTDDFETALSTTMGQAVESATKDVVKKAEDAGCDTVSGYNAGIEKDASTTTDKVNTWVDLVTEGIENKLDIHSPSKVTAKYGQYTVEGFNEGIDKNADTTKTSLDEWMQVVTDYFSETKWTEISNGITTGITAQWTLFRTQWDAAMLLWKTEGIDPYFSYDAWYLMASNISLAISTAWTDTMSQWTLDLSSWWTENVIPYFGYDAWYLQATDIKTAIKTVWDEIALQWNTDITDWWTKHVQPYFSLEEWTKMGGYMRSGIKAGFQGVVSDVGSILNSMIDSFNSAFQNIGSAINDLIEQYNKLASKTGQGDTLDKISMPSAGHVSIPQYAAGGMPSEASLFWAGENGVAEMVGTVGGKTAVASGQEITGITDAVYSTSNAEVNLIQTAIGLLQTIAAKDTTLEIDGRELASAINTRTNRNGFSFT